MTSAALLRDLYLDMLMAERGAAKNTLDAYRRDLDDYLGFLTAPRRWTAGRQDARIRAYLAELDARGLKPSSAARRLSALRQFHKFLFAEGHRGDDPTVVLDGPKRGRPLPKVLSADEVDRLIAAARERCDSPDAPPSNGDGRCGCIAFWRCSTRRACACPN